MGTRGHLLRVASALTETALVKTSIYVDGFNLYYGCVRGTCYRWLDLGKLCRILLPRHDIKAIKYFTALVDPRPGDPGKQQRQKMYIRALETIPNLTVYYGQFKTEKVWRPMVNTPGTEERLVRILDTKEKGSDVNLATHLLVDGFKNEYGIAVVVSNDSDLVAPILAVREHLGCDVGVINPHRNANPELRRAASFYRRIRERHLRKSLFPDVMEDKEGRIIKPMGW